MSDVAVTVELGREVLNGRVAAIKFNGVTVFSEIVYDNEFTPGEKNIVLLFAAKLRRLLEADDA